MLRVVLRTKVIVAATLAAAMTPAFAAPASLGPAVDYHQHLLSPDAAAFLQSEEGGPSAAVAVPPDITAFLRQRAAAWNNPGALAPLYAEDALVTEARPVSGRKAVAEFVGTLFARPYEIMPTAFSQSGARAQLAGTYTRADGPRRKNVGLTLLTLARNSSGHWQIASEAMKFPAPKPLQPFDAGDLVKLLDEADIRRAVVLSVAYFFESPLGGSIENGTARLKAENDWTAAQVARYPARLVGFCSVNPLTATALPEIDRCADVLHLKGLKLHAGNSGVDFSKPEHLAELRQVFAAANRHRLPIVIHLWNGPSFGRADAQALLERVLPAAPDVPVQIAHMAGGGPGWTDEALVVLAEAVARHDRRTRNLYFDVATVADEQTPEQLRLLARRIRQIGPSRILYGSDGAFGDHKTPDQEWGTFRGMVPLTDAEFATIRSNVAPYLR